MKKLFFGVDWGGTRLKLAAISGDYEIVRRELVSAPAHASAQDVSVQIELHLRTWIAELGTPNAIGLGLTGVVDPDHGVVYLPGKVRDLEGLPLVPLLRKKLCLPVWADNDGRAAMYAERHIGAAQNVQWAVMLTLGTGVGSGVLLNGDMLLDPNFLFGIQAGHLVIDRSYDQLCLTGARGTAETLCSATALALAVRSGLQRGIPSLLAESYWREPQGVDFLSVIKAVEAGDRLCRDELQRWTARVGALLVSVAHAYSPQVIILGGGAMGGAAHFLPQLQTIVDEQSFRYPPERSIPIVRSPLDEFAGAIGAALMAQARGDALNSKG